MKLNQTIDFKTVYAIEEEIGRGRFAKVCRVCHKEDGSRYAAKIIRRRRNGVDTIDSIRQEIEILRMTSSVPSIVSIHDVFETRQEITLMLEYSSGGDLYHLVLAADENLTESFVVKVMQQLLESVVFLHERSIVHLDIKPENILLKSEYPCVDIALCDFGLAKVLDQATRVRDLVGTPDYVAPEILDYEPIELASDIWSVGVVCYYLLTSISPFNAETPAATYSNVAQVRIDYPDDLFKEISQDAVHFMQSVIRKSPKDRLSAPNAACHSWLSQSVDVFSSGPSSPPSPSEEEPAVLEIHPEPQDMVQLSQEPQNPTSERNDVIEVSQEPDNLINATSELPVVEIATRVTSVITQEPQNITFVPHQPCDASNKIETSSVIETVEESHTITQSAVCNFESSNFESKPITSQGSVSLHGNDNISKTFCDDKISVSAIGENNNMSITHCMTNHLDLNCSESSDLQRTLSNENFSAHPSTVTEDIASPICEDAPPTQTHSNCDIV